MVRVSVGTIPLEKLFEWNMTGNSTMASRCEWWVHLAPDRSSCQCLMTMPFRFTFYTTARRLILAYRDAAPRRVVQGADAFGWGGPKAWLEPSAAPGRGPLTAAGTKIVYFGTPEVAVAPLRALHDAGHDVVLVVTRPPRRRGRRQDPTPSPVAAAAAELGLVVTHDLNEALRVEADLGVVVAYGEHIPDEALERRRTVNLHFSLLPRWRGAAPVERAILAGDIETGVCLMDVASEIDTGAVYRRASTAIGPHESADELRARLCEMGIGLLVGALSGGLGDPVPQSGEMTWADKISPSDLRIDWSAPAEHILRRVRVGGAWTTFRGRRLKVLEAGLATEAEGESGPMIGAEDQGESGPMAQPRARGASGAISLRPGPGRGSAVEVTAGRGALELVTVQSEGRAPSPARHWCNGARLVAGERFDE